MRFPDNIESVYTGSRYDPGQKPLLQWAIYPRDKRPLIMDPDEMYATLSVYQVGKSDPMETTMLNLNVARLNIDQMDYVKRSMEYFKYLYHNEREKCEKWQETTLQLQKESIPKRAVDLDEEHKIIIALQDVIY